MSELKDVKSNYKNEIFKMIVNRKFTFVGWILREYNRKEDWLVKNKNPILDEIHKKSYLKFCRDCVEHVMKVLNYLKVNSPGLSPGPGLGPGLSPGLSPGPGPGPGPGLSLSPKKVGVKQ